MDSLASQSSVKLVVKTPNQRVKDIEVSCLLDWTVARLKNHLSTVYPTKPARSSQKIIYSGKLLDDHFVLKDVLKENEGQHQTVHLVCTPSSTDVSTMKRTASVSSSTASTSNTPTGSTPSSSSTVTSNAQSETDGLRHRGNPMAQNPYYNMSFGHPFHSSLTGQPNMNLNTAGYPPPDMTTSYAQYFGFNHVNYIAAQHMAQIQWMQHMTQLMQGNMTNNMYGYFVPPNLLNQQQNLNEPPTNLQPPPAVPFVQPSAAVPPVQPPAAAPPVQQQAVPVPPVQPAQERQQNAPAENQNRVMDANPGGGMAQGDDDEENAQRDWLDVVYMIVRVGMLMSIFWFYSSFERIVALGLVFFLIWLIQSGLLNLNRAPRNRQEIPVNADEQDEVDGERPGDEAGTEEGEVVEGDSESESETGGQDLTNTNNDNNGPGFFVVVFNFVVTFFTSLVPQQPRPIAQP
ncbi:homocysteine-responsive endoplasmic reticulum-resident ubiquitin-like domain member 2 protein isoform X2 [Xenia sp. Carnegie-2017]|uniref:homocysteine-responsive endoplasmic reticulum-resident ubiquitin-like domain member 2 protein isoform X2 n=1 Tax=Xenia sp. Carnegie-2017 TaxID=2897299 RepID=UPI001F0489F4|nr:homocysteine-responsive endoplasmic reticulum-resident ubiquitin-like domain member 2 protein isoform X2 [Xenia sp. Carnegie-2017]